VAPSKAGQNALEKRCLACGGMKSRFFCNTARTPTIPAALGLCSANNSLISFISLVNALTAGVRRIITAIIIIIIIIIIAIIVTYIVENCKNTNFECGSSN